MRYSGTISKRSHQELEIEDRANKIRRIIHTNRSTKDGNTQMTQKGKENGNDTGTK